jgi:hypothetical protein
MGILMPPQCLRRPPTPSGWSAPSAEAERSIWWLVAPSVGPSERKPFVAQIRPTHPRHARSLGAQRIALGRHGSHDYAVRDLLVPTERACAFDGAPRVPGLLYRLPRQALLDNAMAVIPLGFVDQHRVGEAKFADRGGDLRDLLVAVRARVSGVGDQRRSPAPNDRLG